MVYDIAALRSGVRKDLGWQHLGSPRRCFFEHFFSFFFCFLRNDVEVLGELDESIR